MSGDNNTDGFSSTMKDMPFVAVPFAEVKSRLGDIGKKVPCTGYPTPGWVNAKTGAVLKADAFDELAGCTDS